MDSEKISQFTSCELSDALIRLGIPSGGHIPDIVMVSPSRDDPNLKLCGPAFTVQMVSASDKESPTPSSHFVDAAPPGCVMVISAPPDVKSAVWGGLMTAGAKARHVRGVVISGRCRDLAEHRQENFPVFARGHSTLGQGGFTRPSVLNQMVMVHPVTIEPGSFPSVDVVPGDIILADIDGVVCVPSRRVDEVVEICAKAREVDAACLTDIRAGLGVQASFKKWRGK